MELPRTWRSPLIVLGAAAAARVIYFVAYQRLPFLEGPLFDSLVYLRQAEAVTSGNFGDATLLAFSPLYGYFLAIAGMMAPVLQMFMGLATLSLLYLTARKRFGETPALATLCLAAACAPLLFYETKIMSETLGMFLAVSAFSIFLSDRFGSGRLGVATLAGVLLGLTVLARASTLFTLPLFALAALVTGPLERRAVLRRTVGLCTGAILVLGANGGWTYAHAGEFVPVTFVPPTVTEATSSDWHGRFDVFAGERPGVSAWDVVKHAEDRIAGHATATQGTVDLAGWLTQVPQKTLATFRNLETTFDYGLYGERTEVLMLRFLPVSFGVLLVLGLFGAFVLARERGARALIAYLPWIIGTWITTTVFYPSGRYRLFMIPSLAILSGFAMHWLWLHRDRARVPAVAVVALTLGLVVHASLYRLKSPGMWHLRVAESEAIRHEPAQRDARIAQALAVEPDSAAVRERIAYIRSLPQ